MTRAELAKDFIADAGWGDAAIAPLAGDASNRRYDRLAKSDGTHAVLMDAPPEKGEDTRPFVAVANYLSELGLSAPKIYKSDPKLGFLLIEDLGDALFKRVIQADPVQETSLYEAAVDVLTRLHHAPPPALPKYDADSTTPLAALAYDWYQLGAKGSVDAAARASFCTSLHEILALLDAEALVLIQRDYHAENLLWLPAREGPARVGLLDFQDARLGHPAYDLVSVLQDARRDVSKDIETQMKERYISQNGLEATKFEKAYAIMGLQRNLRILGVFARLCMRDGKAHYLDFLPRVWEHIETNLCHPALDRIADRIKQDLPPPSTDVIEAIRSKCATCPGP